MSNTLESCKEKNSVVKVKFHVFRTVGLSCAWLLCSFLCDWQHRNEDLSRARHDGKPAATDHPLRGKSCSVFFARRAIKLRMSDAN